LPRERFWQFGVACVVYIHHRKELDMISMVTIVACLRQMSRKVLSTLLAAAG